MFVRQEDEDEQGKKEEAVLHRRAEGIDPKAAPCRARGGIEEKVDI